MGCGLLESLLVAFVGFFVYALVHSFIFSMKAQFLNSNGNYMFDNDISRVAIGRIVNI